MARTAPPLTLVLGGTRSGKSRWAAELARKSELPVTFLATARFEEDPEMQRRIREHRRHRPDGWETREPGYDLIDVADGDGARCYLLDEFSLLVSAWLEEDGSRSELFDRTRNAAEKMHRGGSRWIVVSGLVGRGVVPVHREARRFRDVLGRSNQILAERAGEVVELVAGVPRRLKPPPEDSPRRYSAPCPGDPP